MSDTPLNENNRSGVVRTSLVPARMVLEKNLELMGRDAEIARLTARIAELERNAAAYDTILKLVRPKREREPDPGWMDWIFSTVRADTFEAAIEHQATKELAEMQHRMRAAIREEMRNPTEPSKGEI